MKLLIIISLFVLASCLKSKKENIVIVNTGEIRVFEGKCISTDFAYCSAVIAEFGDSAIFAHALPEVYGTEAFPYIWKNKIYKGSVTSPVVIQSILNITDSLGVDRRKLNFYIIAGCKEEGLDQIIPSIKHYNLNVVMLKLDNTFRDSVILGDISFDLKTKKVQIKLQP